MSTLDPLVEAIAERAAAIVLERLGADAPAPSPASPYARVAEAAELLRCEPQRIHDLLSQRRLTRYKEGGRTLVLRSELEELVIGERRRCVAPALPPASRGRSASGVAQ